MHGASLTWDAAAPDSLRYERAAGGRGAAAELQVVRGGGSEGWR